MKHPLTSGTLPLWVVLIGSLGALGAAHASEWIWGLAACDLCYTQRHGYWGAIAAACLGLLATTRQRALLIAALFGVFASGFVGVYHAGIEWQWWPGPGSCSGAAPLPESLDAINDLLKSDARVAPCGEAQIRFFGLSLAGLNALYAFGLAVVTIMVMRRLSGSLRRERETGLAEREMRS